MKFVSSPAGCTHRRSAWRAGWVEYQHAMKAKGLTISALTIAGFAASEW